MSECIDLKERFGTKYRIGRDPAYHAEHGDHGRADDPWTMTILAKFGHIYPWDGDRLAASVDGHPNVTGIFRRMECCEIYQDGDDGELTALFHVDDFETVAEVIKPKAKRKLSAEHRARLLEAGKHHQFQRATGLTPYPEREECDVVP